MGSRSTYQIEKQAGDLLSLRLFVVSDSLLSVPIYIKGRVTTYDANNAVGLAPDMPTDLKLQPNTGLMSNGVTYIWSEPSRATDVTTYLFKVRVDNVEQY